MKHWPSYPLPLTQPKRCWGCKAFKGGGCALEVYGFTSVEARPQAPCPRPQTQRALREVQQALQGPLLQRHPAVPRLLLRYQYRDGANYKYPSSVVLLNPKGLGAEVVKERLMACTLDGGGHFMAGQVGLAECFFDAEQYPNTDDHCWHELLEVEATDEEPTDLRCVEELLADFQFLAQRWQPFDPVLEMPRRNLEALRRLAG